MLTKRLLPNEKAMTQLFRLYSLNLTSRVYFVFF